MRYFLALFLLLGLVQDVSAEAVHALAMDGEPRYGRDFTHFDYVRPDAPKGGQVTLASIGTFDSFNPYIVKGNSASGLELLFDTLTAQSGDEPFTEYGLVAESMEMPADRSSITFHLREEARFHDGSPVRAEDVTFTFQALVEKGNPHFAQYYAEVERVEAVSPLSVTFFFKPQASKELPLILGQLPVLSKAFWDGRDFAESSLDVPVGSGPYRIKDFRPGQSVTYELDPNYWGRDLPVNKGRYNFATITFDCYRDLSVTLEAFKAGAYDYRQEYSAKQWSTGYAGPALRAGLIRTETIPHKLSQGMQCFVFNTRRAMFTDSRVREALNYAFDFEWTNKNLFYSLYSRSTSFFSNSEMAAAGPPTAAERELLAGLDVPEMAREKEFSLPVTDGSGNNRENLRVAADLLREAGWAVQNGRLMKDGQPFEFEMLLVQPDFERVGLPLKRNLARLGINMNVRLVDVSQYLERLNRFDFDMIVSSFPQSLSPGNEQRSFWHSASAHVPGSRNYCGIENPAIDKLVNLVISAPDRASLILRCKALDRALLWGWYVIPQWHAKVWRVAFWDKFGQPETRPDYALDFHSWWVDPDKERELSSKRRALGLK